MHDYLSSSTNDWPKEGLAFAKLRASRHVSIPIFSSINQCSPGSEWISRGLLDQHVARALIFVDHLVYASFRPKIDAWIASTLPEAEVVPLKCHEGQKSVESCFSIIERIHAFDPLRRSEPIVAMGGGALMDTVGLAASLYRRGVPYIRVPTTLLGAVDGAIGAKTGVNFRGMRNRLGAFYPPASVFIDPIYLQTLDRRQLSSGCGEIAKLAIIGDEALFLALEANGPALLSSKFQTDIGLSIIRKCSGLMADLLGEDLWEDNLSRVLDFGHTFSPDIELRLGGELLHGEAVALDVLLSAALAVHRSLLTLHDLRRIRQTLRLLGLPVRHPYFQSTEILSAALNETNKHRDGRQIVPVPSGIGHCAFLHDVTVGDLNAANELLRSDERVSVA